MFTPHLFCKTTVLRHTKRVVCPPKADWAIRPSCAARVKHFLISADFKIKSFYSKLGAGFI